MKDVIWLRINRRQVVPGSMTKSMPMLHRGEYPVKLNIHVADSAFREPVLEQDVVVEDWRMGIDVGDLEFKSGTITATEAEAIREMRREALVQAVRDLGYEVTGPREEDQDHEH